MREVKQLTSFFSAIRNNPRIGTSHISLYMALFQFYNLNKFQNPVNITRLKAMEAAKIRGLATYHKCMKDLAEFGYIEYFPSFNTVVASQVTILKITEGEPLLKLLS
jgi:hypothetical protein